VDFLKRRLVEQPLGDEVGNGAKRRGTALEAARKTFPSIAARFGRADCPAVDRIVLRSFVHAALVIAVSA
jgi:hypothetical protein